MDIENEDSVSGSEEPVGEAIETTGISSLMVESGS